MIKFVLLGLLGGFLIVLAAIMVPWTFIVVCLLLFMVVSPFATSGKGDRNYRNQ
jgi:hypothetical protein